MRVEGTKQARPGQPGDFGSELADQRDAAGTPAAQSRALVVTEAAAPQAAPVYREASFLAHLIATKAHAPQTRQRRRAEPAEAIAAYRTVNALTA